MISKNLLGGSSLFSSEYRCRVTANGSLASCMTNPSITCVRTFGLIIAFGSPFSFLFVLLSILVPGDEAVLHVVGGLCVVVVVAVVVVAVLSPTVEVVVVDAAVTVVVVTSDFCCKSTDDSTVVDVFSSFDFLSVKIN